jgi:NADH-quinone oxidoreductase subunit N
MILLAAGMCFKIAAVPFHMWAPDAYEGAPTPVTAFMSVGVKAASFAFFARLFLEALPDLRSLGGAAGGLPGWGLVLGVVSAITMTWGNLGAITQRNSKRLLAYSAISHAGYLLLGLIAGNEAGYTGFIIYLIVYVAMNLGAFGVIIAMRRQGVEGDQVADLNGLAQRAPGLAFLMTVCLLSLGGIPPTAGFIGKFYLFYGLVLTGNPWLVALALLAVLNTAVSAYYYFLFVRAMFISEAEEGTPDYATSKGVWTAVGVSAALTILIGVYPQPAILLSKRAIARIKPAAVAPARPVPATPKRSE